ncbi:hypothetical protein [Thermophagus xiamenensis]|nr:hypothetical protein [Thermophagus xiamenensis]
MKIKILSPVGKRFPLSWESVSLYRGKAFPFTVGKRFPLPWESVSLYRGY